MGSRGSTRSAWSPRHQRLAEHWLSRWRRYVAWLLQRTRRCSRPRDPGVARPRRHRLTQALHSRVIRRAVGWLPVGMRGVRSDGRRVGELLGGPFAWARGGRGRVTKVVAVALAVVLAAGLLVAGVGAWLSRSHAAGGTR